MRHRRRRTTAGDRGPSIEVLVCRGCCCGSTQRHPDVAHAAHLDLLTRAADASVVPARLRTVGCLSACALSNVVVVRRRPAGDDGRGAATWLGLVLDDEVVTDLAVWLAAGASPALPVTVRRHAMPMPVDRLSG